MKKKLIEVALPLDAINTQSAREKSIRHGHPSTLHLWWARRPLATARAMLFAQLVDDPSNRVEEFRDEGRMIGDLDPDQYAETRVEVERDRLFDLITRMVDWDNLGDESLFDAVRAEIHRSTNGKPPAILDPFAGGGTIPLEAQRLGLEAYASDLNPVAVLINKALIEIPPKFAGHEPVFPDARSGRNHWPVATGLSEDVRRYGAWMRDQAEDRIGHLYPKALMPDGTSGTAIAWIWARTVACPNPACGIQMPLVRSWWLGKKKGKEAFVVPTISEGQVEYGISHDLRLAPTKSNDGTVGRLGATCISCSTAVPLEYVREQSRTSGLGQELMAVVAEGKRSRTYLAPSSEQVAAAREASPTNVPAGDLFDWPGRINVVRYGLTTFSSLFTKRQLTALTTFSDLVSEARTRVLRDALAAGMPAGKRLEAGGTDAEAYADAVATYLAQAISRVTNKLNAIATWDSSPKMESVRGLFSRQAIPMAWDFAEANPFGNSGGNLTDDLGWVCRVLDKLPTGPRAEAISADAASRDYSNVLLATDPPYYDNIGYSDLSDFFYVWLRRSLRDIHPQLLSTMLVPKEEELVANPYRHGGREGARNFFEHGFEDVFTRARASANEDFPIVVYYAFKQSETDDAGQASTGWQTILDSMIRAGWSITATWPVRSELANRLIASGSNALASSIVLALRPRPQNAPVMDRRGLAAEMRRELPTALRALQHASVAPVDLPQAAIGPGMAVFSKYAEVIDADGSRMPVREALRQINALLDEVLSEQEGDYDSETRWCVTWFSWNGFTDGAYGDAETLANAKNSSVEGLRRAGVIHAVAGKVTLLGPGDLASGYDPMVDDRITLWEIVMHLARALDDERGGLAEAGRILQRAELRGVNAAAAHQLAYQLYAVCEKKGWTAPGVLFNALGSSWPELRAAADAATSASPQFPAELDFGMIEET